MNQPPDQEPQSAGWVDFFFEAFFNGFDVVEAGFWMLRLTGHLMAFAARVLFELLP